MKRIRFAPRVPAEVRAIEQRAALRILEILHRHAETGQGDVKSLSGEFKGLMHLRAGNQRVLFDETADAITVHRVGNRKDLSPGVTFDLLVNRPERALLVQSIGKHIGGYPRIVAVGWNASRRKDREFVALPGQEYAR